MLYHIYSRRHPRRVARMEVFAFMKGGLSGMGMLVIGLVIVGDGTCALGGFLSQWLEHDRNQLVCRCFFVGCYLALIGCYIYGSLKRGVE